MSSKIPLTKKDENTIDLLIKMDIPKNVAKSLVALTKVDSTTSVEIEGATALRQPEVSIALQELRRRKWVKKTDIKKEGKGRPVHAYSIAMPFKEIVAAIERDSKKKIEEMRRNIEQLKQRSK